MDTDNGKIVRKCQLTVKDMKENITKKRNNQEMTIREANNEDNCNRLKGQNK